MHQYYNTCYSKIVTRYLYACFTHRHICYTCTWPLNINAKQIYMDTWMLSFRQRSYNPRRYSKILFFNIGLKFLSKIDTGVWVMRIYRTVFILFILLIYLCYEINRIACICFTYLFLLSIILQVLFFKINKICSYFSYQFKIKHCSYIWFNIKILTGWKNI